METCQFTWVHFLWIVVPLTFSIYIWSKYYKIQEPFISTQETQAIIELYNSILTRNPSPTELKKDTKAIERNEYTLGELEIRLYNSDEYKRLVKTQSNMLSPEMTRMIEEKELITYIKNIYLKVRSKKASKEILLPLKDLFIYFDYNPYKFSALLRHTKYLDFEDEFKNTKNLSQETLIELYLATFDDNKLSKDGEALRKTEKIAPLGRKFESTEIKGVSGESIDGALLGLSDTDTNQLIKYLMDKGVYANRDEAGQYLTKQAPSSTTQPPSYYKKEMATGAGTMCTGQRVYITPESKIVKTNYGFSVPQKHPPVCIPLGGKNYVNPVVFSNFLGTPLEDASATQVGSIMPNFEYNEYIDIPSSNPLVIPPPVTSTTVAKPATTTTVAKPITVPKQAIETLSITKESSLPTPQSSGPAQGTGVSGSTPSSTSIPGTGGGSAPSRETVLNCLVSGGVYKNNSCASASTLSIPADASSYKKRCELSGGFNYSMNDTNLCNY